MANDYRPFNGDEQYAMYCLWSAYSAASEAVQSLSRRLKNVPRGEQKLKTAATYMHNVFGEIGVQMSQRQWDAFKQDAKRKGFRVIAKRVASGDAEKPQEQTVVWNENMRVICNAAWMEKCMLCGLKGQEAKKCPLKKAFDEQMIMETGTNPDCWYKPEF